ncbi:MAG: serine/threonine-protein kinase [Pyrinomonadaceae bacterium]
MNFSEISGQTLDDKYRIERELGRGGMGTVYLATHLGTERPVAVKVIAPQFMQRPEFVERFRREARAAGRLRHPNVVDVTDFGFSDTKDGRVAYLVMEYLDGCTLGEVLEEEKNLPVGWTLDILEQVCSAVHEAHEQGIIHRDLKPDNIWLEPNQRGGYTVKVLDFGIAKLEDQVHASFDDAELLTPAAPTFAGAGRVTMADAGFSETMADRRSDTAISESATIIQTQTNGEKSTVILPLAPVSDQETIGTRILAANTEISKTGDSSSFSLLDATTASDLTRVGAVLGTPLYMSPEQCRGDHLDPRSDVYSLGVIAYQMLSGETPFSGDFTAVMDAHRDSEPPPLNAKKVRKKLKRVISTALAKDPDHRPQSAEAFASVLKSRSEGTWALLRRAGMIYTEHLPKFLTLAILLYTPFTLITFANVVLNIYFIDVEFGPVATVMMKVVPTLTAMIAGFFCANLVVGTSTWLVNQILAVPLRPVRIRPALLATRKNWKRLIGTGLISTFLTLIGYLLCFVPGLYLHVVLALVAPVVMMENLKGIEAMKRSRALVMRSLRTTAAAVAILFFVPVVFGGATGFIVAVTIKAFTSKAAEAAAVTSANEGDATAAKKGPVNVGMKNASGITITDDTESKDMTGRVKAAVREGLTAILMLPFQIVLTSLSSIIVALLYLKTRQAGGESLRDLFRKFAESEQPRKKWQERVRQRLIQSGRITSRT